MVQFYFSKKDKGKNILITCIPRKDNHLVDLLSKLASSNPVDLLMDVWVKVLKKPSMDEELMVIPINIEET
jgi:hypothetical protein